MLLDCSMVISRSKLVLLKTLNRDNFVFSLNKVIDQRKSFIATLLGQG